VAIVDGQQVLGKIVTDEAPATGGAAELLRL
jgi:hypothetical protein